MKLSEEMREKLEVAYRYGWDSRLEWVSNVPGSRSMEIAGQTQACIEDILRADAIALVDDVLDVIGYEGQRDEHGRRLVSPDLAEDMVAFLWVDLGYGRSVSRGQVLAAMCSDGMMSNIERDDRTGDYLDLMDEYRRALLPLTTSIKEINEEHCKPEQNGAAYTAENQAEWFWNEVFPKLRDRYNVEELTVEPFLSPADGEPPLDIIRVSIEGREWEASRDGHLRAGELTCADCGEKVLYSAFGETVADLAQLVREYEAAGGQWLRLEASGHWKHDGPCHRRANKVESDEQAKVAAAIGTLLDFYRRHGAEEGPF